MSHVYFAGQTVGVLLPFTDEDAAHSAPGLVCVGIEPAHPRGPTG